jgi:Na+-translocating ferredoxin:NAD+ oxidoreductase subunit C
LNQHLGAAAMPVVIEGQVVKKYDLIGKAEGKVSSNVHSSIDGIVKNISPLEIILQRN